LAKPDPLADELEQYACDPLGFVHDAYAWGEGALSDHEGPREWQRDILAHIGRQLQDEATRCQPIRIAVSSGHGIGKSALIAMVVDWAMSTCAETRCVVTANTENQLRTKTWPEVGKWARMASNSDWWSIPAMSMYERNREKSWRADAIPWSENNTEAFAGLHNKGKRIVLIFDEAAAIADKVWEVAEGALTDEDTEILWLVFGNPTRNTGRFRECFRRFRSLWTTRMIDSRTVEGTNKEYLSELVATHGEDSDMVKVRVRGQFPAQSLRQFISEADVDAGKARKLKPEQYDFAPKILTLDPAWEGDDEIVFGLRQGLHFRVLGTLAKNDNDILIANKLADFEDEHNAAAVFVDAGYGTGIVSAGKTMGRNWRLVWFAGEASDKGCLNKRAEMWKLTRDWLKAGGALPDDQILCDDLIGPETVARMDGKIQIESKKDMKARGVPSPNRADALALSFAFPVVNNRKPPVVPIPMASHFARR